MNSGLSGRPRDVGNHTQFEFWAENGHRLGGGTGSPARGVLICDTNLRPGDDGIITAARIRALGWVPVLFITGYTGGEIRTRISEKVAGAPLLRKPIEQGPLLLHLQRAFRGTQTN